MSQFCTKTRCQAIECTIKLIGELNILIQQRLKMVSTKTKLLAKLFSKAEKSFTDSSPT